MSDEITQVVLLPVMEKGIISKLTLKSIGVNAKIKSKTGDRTGWVTLEVPSDRVLFVTMVDETDANNTIGLTDIQETVKNLTDMIESGLMDKEEW